MTAAIRRCTVAELEQAPNIGALLAEYGAESSIAELGPSTAQFDAYRNLEAAGAAHPFGAFQGDDLVGILILLVAVLPHYGARVASTESFFVTRRARKSGAGLRLLHAAEHRAHELGASGIFVSAPVESTLERVLPVVGYRETNRVFFRELA